MPCLVLTGHPCVGKTDFAKKLKERALEHKSNLISSVIIVNEELVCVDRTKAECYATSFEEKSTRSSIKAKIDRSLSDDPTVLVICDSLNYIKGYRYELHCLSKATAQKHGVIWILNSPSVAQEWNKARSLKKPNYFYSDDQLVELMTRFEPPDARHRWDKPLWRVDLTPTSHKEKHHSDTAAQDALEKSVYNMHDLSEAINTEAAPVKKKIGSAASTFKKKIRPKAVEKNDVSEKESEVPQKLEEELKTIEVPPKTVDEQIDDILDEFLLNVTPLKQGYSTMSHVNAQSNVLNTIDSLTSQVCNAIVAAKKQSYSASKLSLTEFGEPAIIFSCPQNLPITKLKRLQKQYVRWIAKAPPDDTSKRNLAESFVRYIELQGN